MRTNLFRQTSHHDGCRIATPGNGVDGRYDIEVVASQVALTRIEREWDQLARRWAPDNPFIHPLWISAWWRAFGEGARLHLLAVRDGAQLVGVLPLMYSRVWIYGMPMRRLGATANDHTPRFGLVANPDADGLHEAIWRYLMRISDSWDILELPMIATPSASLDKFRMLAQTLGNRIGTWRGPDSSLVRVNMPWDDYLSARSSNVRKNLRRRIRRLGREGSPELEICSSGECLEEALADGFRIEAASWKGRGGTDMASKPRVRQFYSTLAEGLVDQRQLRLHFLKLGGHRIAFDYSILSEGGLYSLKSGYDTEYASTSPGTILFYLMLQHYTKQGVTEIDLLGESDDFKRQWTDCARAHEWLLCFSNSLRGRLIHPIKFGLLPYLKRRLPGRRHQILNRS